MADYTDKFTGKQFIAATFSALSASVAAAAGGVVDGRKHEFLSGSDAISKLPYRITRGDQAKFFPGLKEGTSNGRIETSSIIRDTVRQIVYVPLKKKNYQENLIGVDSHVSSTFASGAYLQVSAAFADLYSGVDDDAIFTYGVEEFYNSPSASKALAFVGSLTASFNVFASGTLTSSFSAIDLVGNAAVTPKRTPNFTFNFPSTNYITHFQMSTGFSGSLENAIAQFGGGNTSLGLGTGSTTITDVGQEFLAPPSGTLKPQGNGVKTNANKGNSSAGQYISYLFKSKVAGDADSGSLYNINEQFPGQVHIAVYTAGAKNFVSSGSFQYHASNRNAATGSSTIKTLYFHSASLGGGENSTDYQFFVTSAASAVAGFNSTHGYDTYTMVHSDPDFRTNAPEGFYSPSGSQFTSSIFVQTASGVNSGLGPTFASQYQI